MATGSFTDMLGDDIHLCGSGFSPEVFPERYSSSSGTQVYFSGSATLATKVLPLQQPGTIAVTKGR